jgi:hypothetical protein
VQVAELIGQRQGETFFEKSVSFGTKNPEFCPKNGTFTLFLPHGKSCFGGCTAPVGIGALAVRGPVNR